MSARQLVVITGSSGVGKSATAQALQELLLPEQWLHFSVDTLFYCLPPSVTQRVDQHNDHTAVDAKALIKTTYACALTLLSLGHKVIIDAVILSERGASELHDAFSGFDPFYVDLRCSLDEIRRRTQMRGDRTLEEAEHGHRHALGHLLAHHTVDTTSMSAQAAAMCLAKELARFRP